MSNITITPVQQTVYRVKSERGDFAEITIGTFEGTNGFSLSIRSSFGSYGHYWGAAGDETPLEFLRTCNDDYLMGKLERHREFYPEETIKSLKSEIIRLRMDMKFDANEAREIWDSIEYTDDAKEFGNNLKGLWEYEWYDSFIYGHPRQLVGFFKEIFRPFLNEVAEPTQPASGVFVPESALETLRSEVETAWKESDFKDALDAVRDFLKAIDNEKGGQTS